MQRYQFETGIAMSMRSRGPKAREVHIQPMPIWEDEWEHPQSHSNPRLLQNIEREGITL